MFTGKHLIAKFTNWRYRNVFCLVLILGVALLFRVFDLPSKSLWYDELQSVTLAGMPLKELIKAVRVFDPHPPLYYIQLNIWMQFASDDWWIKFNSVVWSLATLIIIFLIARNSFNTQAALLASFFFAISPFSINYAQEARMYALLMFLGTSSFFCFERFIVQQNWSFFIAGITFALAFEYSHGAGFFILISLAAYTFWVLLDHNFRQWKIFLSLCFACFILLVLYIPWLTTASSIKVGHTLVPNVNQVIETLFQMICGYTSAIYPIWFVWLITILFVAGTYLIFIRNKDVRGIIFAFLLVPVGFCLLISYLYRPIWLARTLAYLTPFWTIIIANGVVTLTSKLDLRTIAIHLRWVFRITLTAAITLLLVHTTIVQQSTFSYDWKFRDAAQYLLSISGNGDTVYVPNYRVFWGMGWYMVGHKTVNPLAAELKLVTSTGVTIVSTSGLEQSMDLDRRYWVVYRTNDDTTPFSPDTFASPISDFQNLRIAQVKNKSPILQMPTNH